MDVEFHYYMTNVIAQRAGFTTEEAYTIAYASQFVDDNDDEYVVDEGKEGGGQYRSSISQSMNILRPKQELMWIYPCFHFIPGTYSDDVARRRDGKMHLLNTTPNSPMAQSLFKNALKSNDLYRIGVVTHAYADTWAHQNFVGYYDYFNAMGSAIDRISPNIGHADAAHDPDIPGLAWADDRLVRRNRVADNKSRFLDAAEHIYRFFRRYKKPEIKEAELAAECKTLLQDLDAAMGETFEGKDKPKTKKKRLRNYKKLIADAVEYDEDKWFNAAVKHNVRGLPDDWHFRLLNKTRIFEDTYSKKRGFAESDWFKFQEAVKCHQRSASKLFRKIYKQIEVPDLDEPAPMDA